jgi:hypothetical protein
LQAKILAAYFFASPGGDTRACAYNGLAVLLVRQSYVFVIFIGTYFDELPDALDLSGAEDEAKGLGFFLGASDLPGLGVCLAS